LTVNLSTELMSCLSPVCSFKFLYKNVPSNAIVNAATNISYRQLIQADVFAVLFMNELKNLTNVVIGKLGKLAHKKNCSHNFFKFYKL
jgi:hypothetical protein